MGSSSPALSNMQFLVLLSAVAVAFANPIPEEGAEAPVALAYVHDATGDVAVDDSPAALPLSMMPPVMSLMTLPLLLSLTSMTPPAMLPLPTSMRSPLLPPWPLPHLPSPTPATLTPTAPTLTWLPVPLPPRLR